MAITRSKFRKALEAAIEAADPNMAQPPQCKRKRITYPMKNFRHKLWLFADEYKQIESVSFDFSEENIVNQLTVAVLVTEKRRIRLAYDYKTETVDCRCIGADCDAMQKTVKVDDLVESVREFFPPKKIVRIVRKKN